MLLFMYEFLQRCKAQMLEMQEKCGSLQIYFYLLIRMSTMIQEYKILIFLQNNHTLDYLLQWSMIFYKYQIISFCCQTNTPQFSISDIALTKSLNNLVNLASIFSSSFDISDYIFYDYIFYFFFFFLIKFFSSLEIILNFFLIYFFFIFLFSFFKNMYLALVCFLLAFFSLRRSSSTSINPRSEKQFEVQKNQFLAFKIYSSDLLMHIKTKQMSRTYYLAKISETEFAILYPINRKSYLKFYNSIFSFTLMSSYLCNSQPYLSSYSIVMPMLSQDWLPLSISRSSQTSPSLILATYEKQSITSTSNMKGPSCIFSVLELFSGGLPPPLINTLIIYKDIQYF